MNILFHLLHIAFSHMEAKILLAGGLLFPLCASV